MTVTARRFQPVYDDNETVSRCRLCGYKVTDQEKASYGRQIEDLDGNVVAEHHFCVFCSDAEECTQKDVPAILTAFWWLFRHHDWTIHKLKIKLRDIVYRSPKVIGLTLRLESLLSLHRDEVFPEKYSETLNEYQRQYDALGETLNEYRLIPRVSYYDALQTVADGSDKPPVTREIPSQKKPTLIKALRAELAAIEGYRDNGYYDEKETL